MMKKNNKWLRSMLNHYHYDIVDRNVIKNLSNPIPETVACVA